jgi:hypothetical protein
VRIYAKKDEEIEKEELLRVYAAVGLGCVSESADRADARFASVIAPANPASFTSG